MLILGQLYPFTPLDLQRLKAYSTHIEIVTAATPSKSELQRLLEEKLPKVVVLNIDTEQNRSLQEPLQELNESLFQGELKIIPIEHFLEQYLFKCYIPQNDTDTHLLGTLDNFSLLQRLSKRIIDAAGSLVLLLAYGLLRPYVNRKIQQQSPGDIFFRQLRVGLNNEEFECIKFRSMYLDAEKDGAKFASKNDSRIFAFGEFMRKMRIDEIPQVFNIIKRQMSLIGPRPEREYWIKKDFEPQIPFYNKRHLVRPGITGWAQVMYPYGENIEDAKQKLMYDLYYIKYHSLWLDIKIIYKTIKVIVAKEGI